MPDSMKCPICGTPLEYDIGYDGDYSCAKCGRAKMFGSEELWQELIRTRTALDIAWAGLKKIGSGNIIEHSVVGHENDNKIFIANKTLDESKTALEQTDVK